MSRRVLSFIESVELATSPEKAFWFTVASDQPSRIDPKFAYWEPDELPPRVGTRNKLKMEVFAGLSMKVVSRFVEFDPPRRFTIEGVRPLPIGPWVKLTYAIEAMGDSRSRYVVTTSITYPTWASPIAKVMASVLRQRIRTAVAWTANRFPVWDEPSGR